MNNINVWDFTDEKDGNSEIRDLKEATFNLYGNGHTPLYENMIDAIEKNRKPYVDARAGRYALELILDIYQSMKSGETIIFPIENFASIDMEGTFNE